MKWDKIPEYLIKIIGPGFFATMRMLTTTVIFGTILGFFMAIILLITSEDGLHPHKAIYKSLNTIVNIVRSFPFIIFMVAIVPFTRALIGTSIGEKAAIVPLTLGAAPFIARIIENSMREVDKQLIEAAKSFGASNTQIIFKVILVESLPSLVSGLILAIITILGSSAMAGAVGAGGLGAVALVYGYQSFNDTIMYLTVFILIIVVQIIQALGNWVYTKLK